MGSDCPRARGRGPPVPRSRSALAVCLGLAVAVLHLAAVAPLTVHLATMCPREPASCPLTPTDGAGSRPTTPVVAADSLPAVPSTARGVSGSTPTCPADWLPLGNRCLFLGLDINNWPTARAACRAAGGALAKFSTHELVSRRRPLSPTASYHLVLSRQSLVRLSSPHPTVFLSHPDPVHPVCAQERLLDRPHQEHDGDLVALARRDASQRVGVRPGSPRFGDSLLTPLPS